MAAVVAAEGLSMEESSGHGVPVVASAVEAWPTAPEASAVGAGATACGACMLEDGESGGDAAVPPTPSPLVAAAAAAKDFLGDACCCVGDVCAPPL